jgi:cytidyltransferase-like protein
MLTEDNPSGSPKEPKWGKITHVKSSLQPKDEQYALFIGRWQPLHQGHKELFRNALSKGRKVCIAIRDVKADEKNPFTAEQVKENIEKEYDRSIRRGTVKVIIIPDICSVEFGRGVGYDIIEHVPPMEIGKISATEIREQMRKGGVL